MALMLGRIVASRLLRRIEKPRLVLMSGFGSAVGVALLLIAPTVAMMATATALIAFSFAPIYPTTLAMVGDRYPRFAGTVFGVFFSMALMGEGGFPWAIGQVAKSVGMRYGMALPLASAAAICLLTTRIMRYGRQGNEDGRGVKTALKARTHPQPSVLTRRQPAHPPPLQRLTSASPSTRANNPAWRVPPN